MIKAGDKVKFNEETKKLYLSYMSASDNCGRSVFCTDLQKAGGVDGEFTVKAVFPETGQVALKELPGWYFALREFKEEIPAKEKAPVKVKENKKKGTMTLTEAYLELCEKYHRQKEINKDLVDEIDQKDRIIRGFDDDNANLESDSQELKEIIRKLLNVKDENYNNVLERYAPVELLYEAREYTGE